MNIYVLIVAFLFFTALMDIVYLGQGKSFTKKAIQNNLIFFIGIGLVIFAGLRFMRGPDFISYYNYYVAVQENDDFFKLISEPTIKGFFVEKGFLVFLHFFRDTSFNTFLVAFAAVSISIKFTFFKKYSNFPLYSIALYFVLNYLTQDFGQIRQGLTLGILLWSIHFIINRKFVPFVILVVIASFFHYTAFVFLLAYFMPLIRIRYYIIFCLILIFQFVLKGDYISGVFSYVINFEALTAKMEVYKNSKEYGGELALSLGAILRLILSCYIVLNEKTLRNNKILHVFASLYLWGYLLFCLLSFNAIFAGRITLYFRMVEIVLIPNLAYLLVTDRAKFSAIVSIFLLYLTLQDYKQLNEADESGYYEDYKTIYDA